MALKRLEFGSVSGTSAFIPRYVTGSPGITGDSGAVRTGRRALSDRPGDGREHR
jgi:hypothetical protein